MTTEAAAALRVRSALPGGRFAGGGVTPHYNAADEAATSISTYRSSAT
jgi:hypothetical protein